MAQTFCGNIQFCNLFNNNRSVCPYILVLKPNCNGCNVKYKTKPKVFFRTSFGTYIPVRFPDRYYFIDRTKNLQLHYKDGCITLYRLGTNNNINGFPLPGFPGDLEAGSYPVSYAGENVNLNRNSNRNFFFNQGNTECCYDCGSSETYISNSNTYVNSDDENEHEINTERIFGCLPTNILIFTTTGNYSNDNSIPLSSGQNTNITFDDTSYYSTPCVYVSVSLISNYIFNITINPNLPSNIQSFNYGFMFRLSLEIEIVKKIKCINTVIPTFTVLINAYNNNTNEQDKISSNTYNFTDGIITIVRDYFTNFGSNTTGSSSYSYSFNITITSNNTSITSNSTFKMLSRTTELYIISSIS